MNSPPVAQPDSYTVEQNTTLTVANPGVIGNDTDPDGDPLSVTLTVVPSHGSITLGADGSFTYAPVPGYAGADGFSYTASDGVTTVPADVTLEVLPLPGPTFDYGDAPDDPANPNDYPTLDASGQPYQPFDGSRRLGTHIDAEFDGQPSAAADGDDVTGAPDDEDGVAFPSPIVPGQTATFDVTVQGTGFLNLWIDWNADHDWADAGEQAITDLPVSTGLVTLAIPVPAAAKLGPT